MSPTQKEYIQKTYKHYKKFNAEFGELLGDFREFRGEMNEFKLSMDDMKRKVEKLPCEHHENELNEINKRMGENKESKRDWMRGLLFPITVGLVVAITVVILSKMAGV